MKIPSRKNIIKNTKYFFVSSFFFFFFFLNMTTGGAFRFSAFPRHCNLEQLSNLDML
jgi:hypothetical protein